MLGCMVLLTLCELIPVVRLLAMTDDASAVGGLTSADGLDVVVMTADANSSK